MFTAIESIYDARTLTLLSSKRRASCCMMYWESSTSRNADGTYDVHAVESMPSPRGDDDYNESRPHLYVQPNVPVIVGGLFFVPWIWHVTDARQIVRLLFDPLRIEYFSIAQTSPQPFPEGVPKSDKALEVKSFRQTTATTLWYDPCTFTLDAYGSRAGNIMVRYASQH